MKPKKQTFTFDDVEWGPRPLCTFDAEVSSVMTEIAIDYWPGIKFLQGEKNGDEEKRSL